MCPSYTEERGAGFVLTSGTFLTLSGRLQSRWGFAVPWFLLLCLGMSSLASANPDSSEASSAELLGAVQADAVESDEDAEEPLSYAGVEEVTVTARRREERLQETPVSVTAFDASALLNDCDMKRNWSTERPSSVPTRALRNTATRMPEAFSRSCFTCKRVSR